jgi:uncharacterized membrane protein
MTFIKAYAATLIVFVLVDFAWLSLMNGFYRQQIGHLMAASPNLVPAVAFYLLYSLAAVVLIVMPGTERGLTDTAIRAAIFGLAAYGTYDLTNMATLRDWPLPITLIDMSWGAILTAIAALAGVLVARW